MVDVFISYSRSNQAMVRQLAEAVKRLGYDVWWDDELPPHRSYGEVITEKIGEARAAIVVWSEDAAASEWVRAEADVARNQKKLIQTSIDGRMPPMPFNQIQFANIGDWHGEEGHPGWAKVKGSLAALCGPPGAPAPVRSTPPPPAAPRAGRTSPLVPALVGVLVLAVLILLYFLWGSSGGSESAQVANQAAPAVPAAAPVQAASAQAAPEAPAAEGDFILAATTDNPAGLEVRGGPAADAFLVDRVARGQVFTTYNQPGDWWRVRTADGTIGYAPHARMRLLSASAPTPARAATTTRQPAPAPATAVSAPPAAPSRAAPPPAAPPVRVTSPARPAVQISPQVQAMRRFCNGGPGQGTPQCVQFHQRMARQQVQGRNR